MKKYFTLLIITLLFSCSEKIVPKTTLLPKTASIENDKGISLILLGTIQDAGSPHIGCKKDCCKHLFNAPDKNRQVISLGLIDNQEHKKYLFDATPDIARQMKYLKKQGFQNTKEMADGIFLTHAHIGHYTGLMYLGKEATDAKSVEVFTMPKMKSFLETNGPWSQLVTRKNIVLTELANEKVVSLSPDLEVTPIIVPHRDEFSETVGYKIKGPKKTALFIPDIDKWDKWEKNIIEEIKKVDYAFLDASFYSGSELNHRDISQIPHPFVIESIEKFKVLDLKERKKVIFIHFNHTNPLIDINSEEAKNVIKQGFKIGKIYDVFEL